MRELRCGAETLVEPDREGSEDRGRIAAPIAAQRFVHMFEAALDGHAMTWKQRQLRRSMRQAFQSGQPVDCRDLADGVHLRVNIERRQARCTLVQVGNSLPELCSNVAERS